MKPRFAIIQPTQKHTEIFGTFIEYFIDNDFEFDIFYSIKNDKYTFVTYYEKLFEKKFKIYNPNKLFEKMYLYDFYIFTTSKDILPIVFKAMPQRCVYVVHQSTYHFPEMMKSIIVSPLIRSNSLNLVQKSYILPIYRKANYINLDNKNIFAVIGTFRFNKINKTCYDKDMYQISKILENKYKKDYKIYFFMRRNDWIKLSRYFPFIKNNDKITNFPGLNTIKMIEKLKKVKFILPLAKKNGLFHWERLTGSVPLAINLNIPMITDKKIKDIYDLQGVITYKENISEIFDKVLNIRKKDYVKLVEILIENRIAKNKINKNSLNDLFLKGKNTKKEEALSKVSNLEESSEVLTF